MLESFSDSLIVDEILGREIFSVHEINPSQEIKTKMLTIYQAIPGAEKFTSDVKDLYGTWVFLFKDTFQIIENDSILIIHGFSGDI